MKRLIYTMLMFVAVTALHAGEAKHLEGKLVDENGEKVQNKFKNTKYFLYYYSSYKGQTSGDKFYTPRFLKLANKKSRKFAVIFCFYGSSTKDFDTWKKAHSLRGNFPAWSEKKGKPFKASVGGYPWVVIKDSEGKVVESGTAHQLWTEKKVQQYTK